MSGTAEQKLKKQPMRKCLGCMQSFPKKELIRVVRTPEDGIHLDFKGKMSGRGAYICRNPECLKKARKSGRIERGFECAIPDEVYAELEKELESGE